MNTIYFGQASCSNAEGAEVSQSTAEFLLKTYSFLCCSLRKLCALRVIKRLSQKPTAGWISDSAIRQKSTLFKEMADGVPYPPYKIPPFTTPSIQKGAE